MDEIFTVDLTLCSKRQIDIEDFVNFWGFLRKHEFYTVGSFCQFLYILSCFKWQGKQITGNVLSVAAKLRVSELRRFEVILVFGILGFVELVFASPFIL